MTMPYGFCECGCGQKTRISPITSRAQGYVAGQPRRFLLGHHYSTYMGRHGDTRNGERTPEFLAWAGMRARCRNPRSSGWYLYGARGITVCERWDSYENFLGDMGRRPSPRHSIDRINNDGNYEPGNCRWATPTEQNMNRRPARMVTFLGETLNVSEWGRRLGVRPSTIWDRVQRGQPMNERWKPGNGSPRAVARAIARTTCRRGHEVQRHKRPCLTCAAENTRAYRRAKREREATP